MLQQIAGDAEVSPPIDRVPRIAHTLHMLRRGRSRADPDGWDWFGRGRLLPVVFGPSTGVSAMSANKPLERSLLVGTSAPARPLWRRAVWMRLGALNGLFALCVLLSSDGFPFLPGQAALVRTAAQVQFMHGMATLACATFMNVGARSARLAPAFFLSGVLLYCLPIYAQAMGLPSSHALVTRLGLTIIGIGWLILAWSARDVDRG